MSTKKQCKEHCLYVDWLKLMSSRVLLDWEYKDQLISLELQRKGEMILKTSLTHLKKKWDCKMMLFKVRRIHSMRTLKLWIL